MKKLKYLFYKLYYFIAVVILIVIMNYVAAWLFNTANALLSAFLVEQSVTAALWAGIIAFALSAIICTFYILGAKKLRAKIFADMPVPEKSSAGASRSSSRCTCDWKKMTLGLLEIDDDFIVSVSMVKRDGYEALQVKCDDYENLIFVSYCPICGGKIVC